MTGMVMGRQSAAMATIHIIHIPALLTATTDPAGSLAASSLGPVRGTTDTVGAVGPGMAGDTAIMAVAAITADVATTAGLDIIPTVGTTAAIPHMPTDTAVGITAAMLSMVAEAGPTAMALPADHARHTVVAEAFTPLAAEAFMAEVASLEASTAVGAVSTEAEAIDNSDQVT